MLRQLTLRDSRSVRVGTAFGLLLLTVRLSGALLLMLVERVLGEADLLLLFDLPTIGMYLLLGHVFDQNTTLRTCTTFDSCWSVQ